VEREMSRPFTWTIWVSLYTLGQLIDWLLEEIWGVGDYYEAIDSDWKCGVFAVFCIIETYVVDVDWLMVPAVDDISWMVMILPRTIAL